MDIRKQFATNEKAEIEGVWFELDDTAAVKVARQGNPAYSRMITRLFEQNKRLLDLKNEAAEAKGEALMVEVMAKTILLDWSGFTEGDERLPYSTEAAQELLKIKDFRQLIAGFSQDVSKYRDEADKTALGN